MPVPLISVLIRGAMAAGRGAAAFGGRAASIGGRVLGRGAAVGARGAAVGTRAAGRTAAGVASAGAQVGRGAIGAPLRGLAAFSNAAWGITQASQLIQDVFNAPSFTQSVDVEVKGGPLANMRTIHWIALAVAFGRLNLSSAGILPFTIRCNWSVTAKQVHVHLEYGIAYMAMAAAHTSQSTGLGTEVALDLKTGFGKLIAGVDSNCIGGTPPQWIVSAMNAQGLKPQDFKAPNGTNLGPNYEFPETNLLVLQMSKTLNGKVAINPVPPVGDGVRTSTLELMRAALSDPSDPQTVYPQRPQNKYNSITEQFEKGNKPDSISPPPFPQNPTV